MRGYRTSGAGARARAVFGRLFRGPPAHDLRARIAELEAQVEELSDRNWEIKEAEERARSFLEAQGDLIVRRDLAAHITYANDAYCLLAGKPRAELIGTSFALPLLNQGDVVVLPDGT